MMSETEKEPFWWDDYGAESAFVANMKELRERQGISQSDLARRAKEAGLQFHQPTVQRIESGERPLKLHEALRLAMILGSDLDKMMVSQTLPTQYEAVLDELDAVSSLNLNGDLLRRLERLDFQKVTLTEQMKFYRESCDTYGIKPEPLVERAADESMQVLEDFIAILNGARAAIQEPITRLGRIDRSYPKEIENPSSESGRVSDA